MKLVGNDFKLPLPHPRPHCWGLSTLTRQVYVTLAEVCKMTSLLPHAHIHTHTHTRTHLHTLSNQRGGRKECGDERMWGELVIVAELYRELWGKAVPTDRRKRIYLGPGEIGCFTHLLFLLTADSLLHWSTHIQRKRTFTCFLHLKMHATQRVSWLCWTM